MSILGQIVAVACFAIAMLGAYQYGRLNTSRRLLIVLRRMNATPSVDRSELDGYQSAVRQRKGQPMTWRYIPADNHTGYRWVWKCDGCDAVIDPGSPRRRPWLSEFSAVANEVRHWCGDCAEARR